jgi:hypothetical protein
MSKPFDETTRAAAEEFMREQDWTLTRLAKEVGYSASQLSRYIAGKPEGNVEKMERVIQDVLKSAARRIATDVPAFRTNVTDEIAGVCDLIRKTNDVGLLHGPAGVGKTVGILMFADANKSTIIVTASRMNRDDAGMCRLIFGQLETRGWDRMSPRSAWLIERLNKSSRLIVVDNAHRLTRSALQWLFDFHDETGCPICLVGNPEVMDAIRANDQMFSRIGIVHQVQLRGALDAARRMIRSLAPAIEADCDHMAKVVAENKGHLRAVKKQVLLARDLMEAGESLAAPASAFHAAHKKLVHEYDL